jgi:hypothetical protein
LKADGSKSPFESWDGWTWDGDCKREADKDVKRGGAVSALLSSTGNCREAINQKLSTEAGWYKLTMYIRAENLKDNAGRAARVVFEPKGAPSIGSRETLPSGTYAWRKVERIVNMPAAYADNVLYIYQYGSGKLWVDDVSLEKVDGAGLKEGLTIGDPEKPADSATAPATRPATAPAPAKPASASP